MAGARVSGGGLGHEARERQRAREKEGGARVRGGAGALIGDEQRQRASRRGRRHRVASAAPPCYFFSGRKTTNRYAGWALGEGRKERELGWKRPKAREVTFFFFQKSFLFLFPKIICYFTKYFADSKLFMRT
jgi:hypothetical protein